jgi:two-component system, NtrC family, sensor histidine kinase KinB
VKLRTKILLGYGLTLSLMIVVWISAIIDLRQLSHASEAILRENFPSILAAENMIDTIERQDSGLLLLMLGFEEDGLVQFRQNEVEFVEWLGRAKANITVDNEGQTLQTIEKEYLAYLAAAAQLRETLLLEPDAASTYYYEAVLSKFKSVRDTSIRLRQLNDQAMMATSERAQGISARATWSMIVIGAVAAGLGLAFSLLLSSRLVRPLHEMTAATQAAAYTTSLELARRCADENHLEAASEHAHKAIALDPSRPEAFNMLGAVQELQGDRAEAMKNYRVALDLDPTYEPARQNLVRPRGRMRETAPDLG